MIGYPITLIIAWAFDSQAENSSAPVDATPPDQSVYTTKVISAGDVPPTECQQEYL
jgi:hypothetical protein